MRRALLACACAAAAALDVSLDVRELLAGGAPRARSRARAAAAAEEEEEEDDDSAAAAGAPAPARPDGYEQLAGEGDALPAAPLSAAERAFLLPPGRVLALPREVAPRALALARHQGGLVVVDGAPHGDRGALGGAAGRGWGARLLALVAPPRRRPYPSAYLLSPRGALLRNMEFPDAATMPFGAAEGPGGHVAFTFYQGAPDLEVWQPSLNEKLTFHDSALKPALPTFDAEGLLWVPFTIADRLGEAGEGAVALIAYRADGSRWEAFARRQLAGGARLPHALRLAGGGLVALAGLREWAFQDGQYGPELKEGLDARASHTALSFFALSRDAAAPEFIAEKEARWAEVNGRPVGGALSPAEAAAARDMPLSAVLVPAATFDFPFALCLWPLFALMGDGHAVAACHGSAELRVLRYGDVVAGAAAPPPADPSDPAAPPPPAGFGGVELRAPADARVVADVAAPWGVGAIAGLAADPSGRALLVLDAGGRRVLSAPWPWPGLEPGAPAPARVITEAPPLPGEKLFTLLEIPRSS